MSKELNLLELGIRCKHSAVAAMLKINNLNIFSAPFRCINSHPEYVLFHAIGGRCLNKEPWPEAIKREVNEELEEEVILISAPSTHLYSSEGYHKSFKVSDYPQPLYLLNRTARTDKSFYHSGVNWVIGYQAEIKTTSIYPRQEVALLLLISDDMLIKCMRGSVTYQEIAQCKDGSQIIARHEAKLDYKKLALPAGLAIVSAKELMAKKITR